MNDKTPGDDARQRLTRCLEGHVFDAAAHSDCPVCSARSARGEDTTVQLAPPKRDEPAPRPAWLTRALMAGGAVVTVLMIIVALRSAFRPDADGPAAIVAASASPPAAARIEPPSEAQAEKEIVAAPGEPARAQPRAIERWRTVMLIGGRNYTCVNETTPDGRYRLGEDCPPPFNGETGVTIVNADGSWTSRSDAGRTDAGTIEFIDADHFIAHTRGGPVVWERAD